jgi:hypothetical protein
MSWVTLALGLIRDVATTEQGQEIINDLRTGGAGRATRGAPNREEEVGEWRQSVEERLSVTDRNTEMLLHMLNAQDESLAKAQQRQRLWNLILAASILVAIAIPVVWWLFGQN